MVEAWIEKCRLGDYVAMTALAKEFSPKLYKIAYPLLGNAKDAEEATKEAFVRIFRSLVQFRGDFSPEIWMFRVQIMTCKDFLRARGSFRPLRPEDASLQLTEPTPVPDSALAAKDLPPTVLRLFRTLPTDYMVILLLCDIEGLSQKEAALALDCPLDAAALRLSRARQLLFSRFSGECEKNAALPAQSWQEQFPALSAALRTLSAPAAPEDLGSRVWEAFESAPEAEPIPGLLYRIFTSWQLYVFLAVFVLIFTFFVSRLRAPRQATPRTNPYITERAPFSMPAFPFGPMPAEPSPSPSPSPTVSPDPLEKPDATAVPILSAEPVPVGTPYVAMPTSTPARTPLPTLRPLSPTPTPTKKPSAAQVQNPPAKVYSPVSSLLQRNITFVVHDPEAEAVFQSVKSGGVNAVKEAFAQNGISYSVHETVLEDYSDSYNALANEANALAQKIANGQGGNLRARLVQKESEMETLKNRCASPSLSLSYR